MNDLAVYGIVLGTWFVLQLWVFPKLGIPTCMSGACSVSPKKRNNDKTPKGKYEGQIDLVNKES